MTKFEIVYWLAILAEIIIRAPFNKKRKAEKMSKTPITTQEMILLNLLLLGGFILPLIHSSTNWLDFANYALPDWAGWLGVALITAAIIVFWRAHADLGLNWSPTLEIREKHELIKSGIYQVIRHPMYASQWILTIGQPLLLHNWIAGFSSLLVFIPFYVLRVRAEEQMMIETFGEEYREYMRKTGAVVPKLGK